MESKKLKIKKALSLGIVTSIILITRSGSVQAFDKDHIKGYGDRTDMKLQLKSHKRDGSKDLSM